MFVYCGTEHMKAIINFLTRTTCSHIHIPYSIANYVTSRYCTECYDVIDRLILTRFYLILYDVINYIFI